MGPGLQPSTLITLSLSLVTLGITADIPRTAAALKQKNRIFQEVSFREGMIVGWVVAKHPKKMHD
jgi:hypothetical protein